MFSRRLFSGWRRLPLTLVLAGMFLAVGPARLDAQFERTSKLLLPYFEVRLDGTSKATVFTVTNITDDDVEIQLSLRTNWGFEVSKSPKIPLGARQERVFHLNEWIVDGQVPDGRKLEGQPLLRVRRGLAGEKVPPNDAFLGKRVELGLAVGYVEIEIVGSRRPPKAICGDYFLITTEKQFGEGEVLVDLADDSLCMNHAVFLLKSGIFDSDTKVMLWTGTEGRPSRSRRPNRTLNELKVFGYDDDGERHDLKTLKNIVATQMLTLERLGWKPGIEWLELESDTETFVAAHFFNEENHFSAALRTCCVPKRPRLTTTTTRRSTTTRPSTTSTTTTTTRTTRTTRPSTTSTTSTPTSTPTTSTPTTSTSTPTTSTSTPTTSTTTSTPTTSPTTSTTTTTTRPELQGCTPGYWRQSQHLQSWERAGVNPNARVDSVFSGVPSNIASMTLQSATRLRGGGDNALMRHAVSAFVNASHPGVNYSFTPQQVVQGVATAFANGTVEQQKDAFAAANKRGCPLGRRNP